MKYLLPIMLLTLFSCARHHEKSAHHHDQEGSTDSKNSVKLNPKYDKECACSVMEGDKHVAGKEEFKLEHAGDLYYFSTKEKMEKFKENLTENISKADKNWSNNR